MKTLITGCALLAATSLAPLHAQKPTTTVEYKTTPQGVLKLHVFNPADHKASDKTPAIVFFFGGGWVGGSPSQFYDQCAYLASRGMVAISAEYRVKKAHKTTPKECVKDGKSAVRWIRAHAKELGINPDKLAAGGGSAGGHVAAATGTLSKFEEEGEDAEVSSRPNALVLFNPVYDNGPKGYGHDRVKAYWKDISPMHNISKTTPPTIVFLGEKDKLIPVSVAKAYQKSMADLGIRSDLHTYPNQPHGFFNKSRSAESYVDTVQKADIFLESLGYLSGKPTVK